jgi:hypothetical protein
MDLDLLVPSFIGDLARRPRFCILTCLKQAHESRHTFPLWVVDRRRGPEELFKAKLDLVLRADGDSEYL